MLDLASQGRTMMIVTHEMQFAKAVACLLYTSYACYQVKKEAERADIMYEIWSNSGIHDLKLEDVCLLYTSRCV